MKCRSIFDTMIRIYENIEYYLNSGGKMELLPCKTLLSIFRFIVVNIKKFFSFN